MCGIDFMNACDENIEYEARMQARYDNEYDRVRNKSLSDLFKNTIVNDDINNRMARIEERVSRIETRLDSISSYVNKGFDNEFSKLNESNNLFVFAPSSSYIKSAVTLQLTDQQFKEMINQIMK